MDSTYTFYIHEDKQTIDLPVKNVHLTMGFFHFAFTLNTYVIL